MPVVFQVAAAIFGFAGLAGGSLGVLQARASKGQIEGLKESLGVFASTNEEMRRLYDRERSERQMDSLRFSGDLQRQDAKCQADMAELRGQLMTYESGLAERLVKAVLSTVNHPTKETS